MPQRIRVRILRMAVLLIIGGIIFVIGVVVTLSNIKNFQRRSRIIATPTSPIAQAPGGLVEIKGRIVPSEQGVLQTPFSGRHAVWCRVTVEELRSSGKNSTWVTVLKEVDQRAFMVDDGSGQLARIEPVGANVILDASKVASSGTFNDPPQHLVNFVQARGITTTSWLGLNKSMRYSEEVLHPQDPLYALGQSRRDPGPPVNDGYRIVPSSQLVMFHAMGVLGELLLSNKTEDQLTSKLLTGFVIGVVMAGLGFFGTIAGGIGAALGY